ncbi:MAG: heme exporter protein CcmB [Dongiaceae bacterium]
MTAFHALVRRDLQLALRQGADAALVFIFYSLAVLLFPFGVGPEANMLARISVGILWVMALLSALLALERLFQAEHEDGSLDQLALLPMSLGLVALAKMLAHWLLTGLPLVVFAPVLALALGMNSSGYPVLIGSLLLGTPCLSLIGGLGAALTLGARRGGALLALLILPLYVPVLIFGVAAVDAAMSGLSPAPHLMILTALLLAALPLCPWATAAALRHALE